MKLPERLAYKLRRWTLRPPPPAALAPDAEAVLASMYAWEPQPGHGDALHPLDGFTRIARARGDLLYHYCREVKPDLSIEVGLAYGFSTVFLLSALREQGRGHHIAIDPFQTDSWHGIGAAQARKLGMQDRFTLIEERSEQALVRLALEGREAQLVFIDGDHRFDGALLDFTLADRLVPEGGLVVFDDLWMPSVQRVVAFIDRNRSDWERLPPRIAAATAFRKVAGGDPRAWDHFVRF